MREITCLTVVVGSGCAGLNAADWLAALGAEDVLLVTENMRYGTSRNTGSDKQTYYKLSLAGGESDSVEEMARTLHREWDGTGTWPCARRGVCPGVPEAGANGALPCNEMGEFVGYQTGTTRPAPPGSSAGPHHAIHDPGPGKSVLARGVRNLCWPIASLRMKGRVRPGVPGPGGLMALHPLPVIPATAAHGHLFQPGALLRASSA